MLIVMEVQKNLKGESNMYTFFYVKVNWQKCSWVYNLIQCYGFFYFLSNTADSCFLHLYVSLLYVSIY